MIPSTIQPIISVPTKICDGGSSEAKRKVDAFSYYSNHKSRMVELLQDHRIVNPLLRESIEETCPRAPIHRQTRVSFELHPSLILGHALLEDNYDD